MALRRRGRLDRGLRLLVVLTVAIGVGSSLFHTVADRWTPLNGSLSYAPALLALLVMGLHFRRVALGEPWLLLVVAALFAVSLSLRSVDLVLCPLLPLGTHLFWHLLNALVLVLAARSLLMGPAPLLASDRPPGQTGPQAWRP